MGVASLIVLAAEYGVAVGSLLPRALYRLSVEPGEPWRGHCPEGHPVAGWLGPARCRHAAAGPDLPSPAAAATNPDLPSPVVVATGPDLPPAAAPRTDLPPPAAAAASPGSASPEGPGLQRPGVESPDPAEGPGLPRPGAESPDPCGDPGVGVAGRRGPHGYGMPAGRAAVFAGAVCAALAGAVGARPEGVAYVALAPVLVLLVLVDRAVHRLPDALTLPLAAAAAAALGGAALAPGAAGSWRLALLGGGALGASYLLLHLINPAGLGFGDVKLALTLGVALGWYGWGVWAAGAFLGFLYGALYGLSPVLRGSAPRKEAFAFGPFMAAGALTGVLLGGFGA
ncbi:A24 family peptidase [Streptomyces sp. ISL-94]|uniref:prepilin peptidase n=1 Tax=Streptomyces sp. ISL-94 TaxID=2819190 RepID=UPI001BE75928|nr:A24 family peptidase [Streptomyces sp. ISL-94]MBT2478053.1 prepilin peptidase [Streptomyces sp. ISL-94]